MRCPPIPIDLAARVASPAVRRDGNLWASIENRNYLAMRFRKGLVKHIREVFDLPQTCEARQLARLLHRFARARIGGVLVDCDRSWPHSMRLLQCLAKEAPRSGRIALAAQKEIDRLPSAVNGTVKICPPTFHFDVGLVHSPRAICHLKMGSHPLYRSQARSAASSETRSCDRRKPHDRPASAQGLYN